MLSIYLCTFQAEIYILYHVGYGQESCVNSAAQVEEDNVVEVESIICSGTSSCMGMEIRTMTNEKAECVGHRACFEADIEAGEVVCDGEYGCKKSQIIGNNVYINGQG